MPTSPVPAPATGRPRRSWFAHPAAAGVVHGVAGSVTGFVGLATGGLDGAVLLTFGVLAGIVVGAPCASDERRLAWALAAGALAMPFSLVSASLAWGLAGFHLARAFAGPPERAAAPDGDDIVIAMAERRTMARRRV